MLVELRRDELDRPRREPPPALEVLDVFDELVVQEEGVRVFLQARRVEAERSEEEVLREDFVNVKPLHRVLRVLALELENGFDVLLQAVPLLLRNLLATRSNLRSALSLGSPEQESYQTF